MRNLDVVLQRIDGLLISAAIVMKNDNRSSKNSL
jgi:hypothetical protein